VKVETAAMRGVGHLYHYQPYKTDWLRRTVLHDQIYFSNPKDFNDPWDCRPRYNEEGMTDPAYCAWLVSSLDANARKHRSVDFNESAHAQHMDQMRNNPSLLKDHLRKVADEREKVIQQRYTVYCLVPRANSALMWAHYANKHRGVCLEFSHVEVFRDILKVIYCEKYPSFEPFGRGIDKILPPLLTKSADWEYEEEYRIIAEEKGNPDKTFVTENNYFSLPPRMLKSIILGALISSSDEAEIREMVAQRIGRPLVLKRAVRVPNRYSLSVEPG